MTNIIQIQNLEKTYVTDSEKLTILKDLNFCVPEGKKVVISGASGSGKSTLLNIIAGIDTITSGSVFCGSWEVSKLTENQIAQYRSKFLGLVFQFHYLLKDFTALENIYLPSLIAGTNKKIAIEKALSLLDDVGLSERKNHLPSQLSGGERQRIAVARSLINDPSLILADEPTGNLDFKNAMMIGDVLFNMVEKYKKTLVLVTHDQHLSKMGDICYTIKDYKLEEV